MEISDILWSRAQELYILREGEIKLSVLLQQPPRTVAFFWPGPKGQD